MVTFEGRGMHGWITIHNIMGLDYSECFPSMPSLSNHDVVKQLPGTWPRARIQAFPCSYMSKNMGRPEHRHVKDNLIYLVPMTYTH